MADYKVMAKQIWKSTKRNEESHRNIFVIETDDTGMAMKHKKYQYQLRDYKCSFQSTNPKQVNISKINRLDDIERIVNEYQPLVYRQPPSNRHQKDLIVSTHINNIYDVSDIYNNGGNSSDSKLSSAYDEFLIEIVIDQHMCTDKHEHETDNRNGGIDGSNISIGGDSGGSGSNSSSSSSNSNDSKKWSISTVYAQSTSRDGKRNSMQFTLNNSKIDITPTATAQHKIFLNVRQDKNPNNTIEGSWILCILFEEL